MSLEIFHRQCEYVRMVQGYLVTLDLPFQIDEQIWKDCTDRADTFFIMHMPCSLFNVVVSCSSLKVAPGIDIFP